MIFHIRFKNVQKEPGHTSVQAPYWYKKGRHMDRIM